MRTTIAWESQDTSLTMHPVRIERRDLRDDDIAIRVDYCGVCHSDLHAIHGILGKPAGGLVPGHEFTGVVTEVGAAVTVFEPGDPVAIGPVADSCGHCATCQAGQENYCRAGATSTYGSVDPIDGTITKGGYSREYVIRGRFAYRLPAGLDSAAASPLMCAGITVWEPLRAAGIGPGSTVAVAGLGGLGHLAVKFAAALGAEVTVLSRTADKADDARKLGATGLIAANDETDMSAATGRFDLILDTIAAPHDLLPFINMLALDGTLSVLGFPVEIPVQLFALAMGRRKLTSAGTGGTKGTVEMLAFAAAHGITADIELLPSSRIEEALARLEQGDVRYRFVVDLTDLDTEIA